jgi:hypothetical protein
MFIGYCDTTKAYRLWDPATRRIKISRDVSFDELSPASSSDNPDMEHAISTNSTPLLASTLDSSTPRRSSRGPQPKHCWAEAASLQSTILFDDQIEPKSYSCAISDINAESWKTALSEEMQSLIDNHTWSLAELPPGRSAIGSRWTYTIKRSLDGSIKRYKARFVAKGFSQRPGIDYDEIYSPVIKLDSLRVILSMAANRVLSVTQLDVKQLSCMAT